MGDTMQVRDSFIKGILREKCVQATNSMVDLKTMLSEAPQNYQILEEIDYILNDLAVLLTKFA